MPTTDQGIWYPGPSDPINPLENVFATMASSIDSNMGVRRFYNTNDRDAAYALNPFKLCVVGTDYSTGVLQIRSGANWYTVGGSDNGTYTPVVTGSNTSPSGYTATGTYRRTGNLCFVQFTISLGSNVGSGSYSISAPMAMNDYIAGTKPGGTAYIAAGSNSVIGMVILVPGTPGAFTITVQTANWTRALFGPGAPVALPSGTRINGSAVFGTNFT